MSTNGWRGSGDWQDTEFGHGQEQYYGGQHHDPASPGEWRVAPDGQRPPHGGGGPRKGPLLAGVGILVLALAAGGAYLATAGGDSNAAADGATARPTASVPTDRGRSTSPTGPQRNSGGESDHAEFDVPPESLTRGNGGAETVWQMYEDPRDTAGYGSRTGKNLTTGHAPTRYRPTFCRAEPRSALGLLVWANAHADSPLEAASGTGDSWLKAIATRDDDRMEKHTTSPSLKNVTLRHSGTKAVQFRGKTALTSASETGCGVTGAEVVVTAFDTGQGTATMVAVRRLGHPDSMSNAQLSTVLNTLRPRE